MLAVHLRINDSATKKPTPVRLAISGPNGEYYPPLGRLAGFACGVGEDVGGNLRVGRENFSYIDGSCEVRLPAGVPLRIRATKGPEFTPIDESIVLGSGQMAVRLEIQRWSNLSENGWMGGDGRAHFLSPHAALLESSAEDVAVTNLLAKAHHHLTNDGNTSLAIPNLLEFGGQSPTLETPWQIVAVNTLNVHRSLGSLALLHSHRPVYPLAFGEPYDTDDWSLFDWSNQCHRKNGLVVWTNAFQQEGGEALAAAILGKIDAVEFAAGPRTPPLLPWYYRLLNAGVRLPLVGASGKDSNRIALGSLRTYANVGDESRTYASWIEAVRDGKTFITNGPLLSFEIGETILAEAESAAPFVKLEIVVDGLPFATATPVESSVRFTAKIELPIPENANWIAARCIGGPSPLYPDAVQFAHSSPVSLGPIRRDAESVNALLSQLERLREWATERANFTDEKWRAQLLSNCDLAAARLT